MRECTRCGIQIGHQGKTGMCRPCSGIGREPGNKGVKKTVEQNARQSAAQTGRRYNDETRRNRSEKIRQSHGNFTGQNKPRPGRFYDTDYTHWRKDVFERDRYLCQMCGATHNINAHHILSWEKHPALRYVINNGLTLCVPCHTDEHRLNGIL